jgi:hypothetical protein
MREGKREEEGHCLATPLDHLVRAHAHPSVSIVTVRAPSIPSPVIQRTCVTLYKLHTKNMPLIANILPLEHYVILHNRIFFLEKGPAAEATDASQP